MKHFPVRFGVVCVLLGLLGATPARAQIEFTPLFGLHGDHPPRSEYAIVYQYTRNLPFGDTWKISQPSTVPAYGGRVELALHPSFRLQGEVLFSKNENSRTYILNSDPPPGTVPVDSAFKVTYRTPPGSDGNTRHDFHLLVGLNWLLGRPIAQGCSHGPSLAPPRTP